MAQTVTITFAANPQAQPAQIAISSSSGWILNAGGSLELSISVTDLYGNPVQNAPVIALDPFALESRSVGTTASNGVVNDVVTMPANDLTGNYIVVYQAGGGTVTAAVGLVGLNLVTNDTVISSPGFSLVPGPLTNYSTPDLSLWASSYTGASTRLPDAQILAKQQAIEVAINAALADELKNHLEDPVSDVLWASGVGCAIQPEIPGCEYVFVALADDVGQSSLRAAVKAAIAREYPAPTYASLQTALFAAVDDTSNVISGVTLLGNGQIEVSNFDLLEMTSASVLMDVNLTSTSSGAITLVDISAADSNTGNRTDVRLYPQTPIVVNSAQTSGSATTISGNAATGGSNTGATGTTSGATNTASGTTSNTITSSSGNTSTNGTPTTSSSTNAVAIMDLSNASVLYTAGPGSNALTMGFVVPGSTPQQVLVRAGGPALAAFGITNFLPHPQLSVFSATTLLASNAGWSTGGNTAELSAAFAKVYAPPYAAGSADSAVLLTLNPGDYTAQVTGTAGEVGTTLCEIFVVPSP
jgi:hypothetical protein